MPRFIPALLLVFIFPGFAHASEPVAAATDFPRVEVQAWLDEGACPAAGPWIVNRAGETVDERYWNGSPAPMAKATIRTVWTTRSQSLISSREMLLGNAPGQALPQSMPSPNSAPVDS